MSRTLARLTLVCLLSAAAAAEASPPVAVHATTGTVSATGMLRAPYRDSLALGPDGAMWYAEPADENGRLFGHIARISKSGVYTSFPVPMPPGAGFPTYVTGGPDGKVWFAMEGRYIGNITPTGVVTEYKLPSAVSPGPLMAGPDGALWFPEAGAQITGDAIGEISTSGVARDFPAPMYPNQQIAIGADGNVWFCSGSVMAFMTPAGQVTKGSAPCGEAVTRGPDGDIWTTSLDTSLNWIDRVGTDFSYKLYPLGTDTGSRTLAAGPDGNVWVLMTGNATTTLTSVGHGGNEATYPVLPEL